MFEAAQARMADNHVKRQVNAYLLTSRVHCTCGRAISTRIKKRRYLYYACSSIFLPKVARTCHEPSVRADILDAQVWDWLMNPLSDEAQLTAGIDRMLERRQADQAPKWRCALR